MLIIHLICVGDRGWGGGHAGEGGGQRQLLCGYQGVCHHCPHEAFLQIYCYCAVSCQPQSLLFSSSSSAGLVSILYPESYLSVPVMCCFCCFISSSSSSSVPRRLNLSINLKGVTFLIPWVIISVFQMAVVRCVIRRLVCQRPRFTGWNSRHHPVCCDDRRLWYQMWLFCAPSAQEWDHVIARDDIAHCDRSQWWPCMFWLINPVAVLLPGM